MFGRIGAIAGLLVILLSVAVEAGGPDEVAVGKPAPPLAVAAWSDGKTRDLGDLKGRVIFLDFWGIWNGLSVQTLPFLEHLRAKYEPKGVVFLSIHTPREDRAKVQELLDRKKVKLIFGLDGDRGGDGDDRGGVTARRYGVLDYPTLIMIDRAGKIAYRSDHDVEEGLLEWAKLAKEELGIDIFEVSPDQGHTLWPSWELWMGQRIVKLLEKE